MMRSAEWVRGPWTSPGHFLSWTEVGCCAGRGGRKREGADSPPPSSWGEFAIRAVRGWSRAEGAVGWLGQGGDDPAASVLCAREGGHVGAPGNP